MTTSCTGDNRHFSWSLFFIWLFLFAATGDLVAASAAEQVISSDNNMTVAKLIEQLHDEIKQQVDQKKLPEERRSQAEMLRRSYAKRKIELNSHLEILKIDASAATDEMADVLEQIIDTARSEGQLAYAYLIRLQMLRNPSAKFEPVSVTSLPSLKSDPAEVNTGGKSKFSIKWVPDDVNSGVHD